MSGHSSAPRRVTPVDVGAWLRGLGLGQYEAAFREHDIGAPVLPELTTDDLKELGVRSVGHRRALLAAIAALHSGAALPAPVAAADAHGPTTSRVPPAGAERRQLTVLFCDLAGSTALSARLDPEDMRAVINDYHRAVADAVRGQGGYVAKLLGDGVLAYFGWPEAHEDDAERAVRAGFAAVKAVSRLVTAGAGPLAARVGIATGSVVVGEVLGEGEARERGVVGETPNLAARLQALTEPGAVMLDDATRRLAGALFEWSDLGLAEVKGLSDPVRAWRALCESQVESRFEALRVGAAAPPMIGREEELELLLRRWRRARAGEGQAVLLRGEAGIGKSRLAAALRDSLGAEAREELLFYCSPQYADSALRPVAARLERAAWLAPGDPPEARLAGLEALLLPLAPPAEDVALVADLLSVKTLGRWPVIDLSPQMRRERLLLALTRRVRALAARRPVLAVVEDAHWLDPTTRELLDLLVAEAAELALLLVVTHRPEFDATAWLGQAHVTPVQLNRLGQAEHRGLLRRVAGNKALPAEIEAEVLARTDGVPLFVEEVGRAVLESGLLREEADCWTLDGPSPIPAVPRSLQASLVARLDRLSSVREVAQAGAVLGREFAHCLVEAMADLPAGLLDEALARLVEADLLKRRGTPPDAVYTFKHALVQDAAYGTLLRERRRALHSRAADAIQRLRPDAAEREAEVLARHRAEAGEPEAAAALYLRAAERSAARSALREARAHLARALAVLPQVSDGQTASRIEAEARTVLGHVSMADSGYGSAESRQAFARAVELCRGLDGDVPLGRALYGLWSASLHSGDLPASLRYAEEAMAVGRERGGSYHAPSLAAAGISHLLLGRLASAGSLFEEALAAPDAYSATGPDMSSGSQAQPYLARLLACRGALDRSAGHAAEAIRRADAAGHLPSVALALTICCTQAWTMRDDSALRERAEALVELTGARGYLFWSARGRAYAGWTSALAGQVAEGLGLITGGIEWLRARGIIAHLPHMTAMLSDAHRLDGDTDTALAHAEEALAISAGTGEVWFDAELHRRVGGLLLRRGEVARGEAELLGALTIARSQSARLFELRAARDLAGLRRDQDRLAEARELLAPVYAAFSEGFGFSDLVEARALLDELGATPALPRGQSPSRPQEPAGLTVSPAR